jgi:hypothetical protein
VRQRVTHVRKALEGHYNGHPYRAVFVATYVHTCVRLSKGVRTYLLGDP